MTNPSNISVAASGNDGGSKRACLPGCDEVTSNHQRAGEITVTNDTNRQRPGAFGTRVDLIPEPEPYSPVQVRSAEPCLRTSKQDQPALVA